MKKRTYLKSACAATTLMISLVSAPPGLAATIRVPADYSTIQAAADAASSGDTVEIAPGVYAEQILIVGKNLTLAGKPGAVVRAFVGMAQTLLPYDEEHRAALLGIVSSEAVVVTGLAFEGEHLADDPRSWWASIFGGPAVEWRIAGWRAFTEAISSLQRTALVSKLQTTPLARR